MARSLITFSLIRSTKDNPTISSWAAQLRAFCISFTCHPQAFSFIVLPFQQKSQKTKKSIIWRISYQWLETKQWLKTQDWTGMLTEMKNSGPYWDHKVKCQRVLGLRIFILTSNSLVVLMHTKCENYQFRIATGCFWRQNS